MNTVTLNGLPLDMNMSPPAVASAGGLGTYRRGTARAVGPLPRRGISVAVGVAGRYATATGVGPDPHRGTTTGT